MIYIYSLKAINNNFIDFNFNIKANESRLI